MLLHRIDTAANMRRFYALSIEPTLFGEMALVREWGRIGRGRGQMKIETFSDAAGAAAGRERIAARKIRRGYVVAGSYPGASG